MPTPSPNPLIPKKIDTNQLDTHFLKIVKMDFSIKVFVLQAGKADEPVIFYAGRTNKVLNLCEVSAWFDVWFLCYDILNLAHM